METDPEIDDIFNYQVKLAGAGNASYINCDATGYAIEGKGMMDFIVGDSDGAQDGECRAAVRYVNEYTDYISGWKQIGTFISIFVGPEVLESDTETMLYAHFISSADVGETTQKVYRFAIGVNTAIDANHFICITKSDGNEANEEWASTGIDLPGGDGQWVTLYLEYNGEKVFYSVDDGNGKVLGLKRPIIYNMLAGVEVGALAYNTEIGAGFKHVYWDYFTLSTSCEYEDDEELYPDHQSGFDTEDIGVSGENIKYNWIKITPGPFYSQDISSAEYGTHEKYCTWSIIDAADDTAITGYEDRVETWASLSGIDANDYPLIYIRIKFHTEYLVTFDKSNQIVNHPFFSAHIFIDALELDYEGADDRLSLECTYNAYSPSDLDTPVASKTGYPLRFKLTADDYYKNKQMLPDDDPVYVAYYWFDFGDLTNSGWIVADEVMHTFTKHSQNTSESGADHEWNVKCRVMWSNGEISGWSNIIDANVANASPVAVLFTKPKKVRMSGGSIATVKLLGHESHDTDDNGFIYTSGGYKFDFGDGSSESWQTPEYATHQYTSAGLFTVGLTVRDDKLEASQKITSYVRILPVLTATLLSFNMRPRQVDDNFSFGVEVYHTIDGGYEEVEPDYSMKRTITVSGQGHNTETDIEMLKGLAESGTPIALQYYKIGGTIATFVGYITSLRTSRIGGLKYDVPWTMTLQYLKNLTPGDDTLTGIMKYDEGTVLPSASVDYVNTLFRVLDAPDTMHLCMRDNLGDYVWIQVAAGGGI
jgi:hypothetical protein